MKMLTLALAAVAPLFILADSNTVSRAEFDALKRDVESLQKVVSSLHIFGRGQPKLVKSDDGIYRVVICGRNNGLQLIGEKPESTQAHDSGLEKPVERDIEEIEKSLFERANALNVYETIKKLEATTAAREELRKNREATAMTNAPTLLRK